MRLKGSISPHKRHLVLSRGFQRPSRRSAQKKSNDHNPFQPPQTSSTPIKTPISELITRKLKSFFFGKVEGQNIVQKVLYSTAKFLKIAPELDLSIYALSRFGEIQIYLAEQGSGNVNLFDRSIFLQQFDGNEFRFASTPGKLPHMMFDGREFYNFVIRSKVGRDDDDQPETKYVLTNYASIGVLLFTMHADKQPSSQKVDRMQDVVLEENMEYRLALSPNTYFTFVICRMRQNQNRPALDIMHIHSDHSVIVNPSSQQGKPGYLLSPSGAKGFLSRIHRYDSGEGEEIEDKCTIVDCKELGV